MPSTHFSFVALLDQAATNSQRQVKREPERETVIYLDRIYIPSSSTVLRNRPFVPLTPRQVKQEPDDTFYWANSEGNPDKDFYRNH